MASDGWSKIISATESGERNIDDFLPSLCNSNANENLSILTENLTRIEKTSNAAEEAQKKFLGRLNVDLLHFILIRAVSKDNNSLILNVLLTPLQNSVKTAPLSSVVPLLESAAAFISDKLKSKIKPETVAFSKFTQCFMMSIAACVIKCQSDKSLRSKAVKGISQCLEVAVGCSIGDAAITCAHKTLLAEKFQQLLVYVQNVSWGFLLRAIDVCGFDSSNERLSQILIKSQEEHLELSCTKGIEVVSTDILNIAM